MNTRMSKPTELMRDFFRAHRFRIASALALDFAANVCALLLPLLLGQAFAAMFGFQSARGRMLGWTDWGGFSAFASMTAAVLVLRFLLDVQRKRLHGILSEDFVYDMRERLFRRHLQMDIRAYERKGIGKYLLRFSGDLGSVQRLLSVGVLQWAADLMLLLAGFALIIWLNPALGILAAVLIGLLLAVCKRLERRLQRTEEQRRDKKSGMLAFVNSRLLAIASLKVFNRETGELQQFERRAKGIRKLGVAYAGYKAVFESLIATGVYGVAVCILIAAGYMNNSGMSFRADHTFALILIVISWRTVLRRVLGVGLVWKRGGLSMRKIADLLRQPIEAGTIAETDKGAWPAIAFQRVSVAPGGRAVLDDLSFELKPGTLGCITGGGATGKTLIVKLLAGLYLPDSGAVRLGRFSSAELHPKQIRRSITFVSKAFPLYGKTLLDAVANSRKKENRDRAATEFQRWQTAFPILQGIDLHSPLSENKERFSEVQLRLLECLRAHLARKPFLVLDDTFQGLDDATRSQLVEIMLDATLSKALLLLTSSDKQCSRLPLALSWTIQLQPGVTPVKTMILQGDEKIFPHFR